MTPDFELGFRKVSQFFASGFTVNEFFWKSFQDKYPFFFLFLEWHLFP